VTAAIEAREVHLAYRVGGGVFGRAKLVHAVRGVSLSLQRGTTLGLVGESGCGKSSLARVLLGLARPAGGEVLYGGERLGNDRRAIARCTQIVFQDPYSSLNPSRTVEEIIRLPLQVHSIGTTAERQRGVAEIMASVGLARRLAASHPHQLSGGQRQRVAIARALVLRPEVVICDEPTSALDVSVQAQILNLLLELQTQFGLSYLLISHNLAVVHHMASRVAVMYLGRIVEEQDTAALFQSPRHPYTRALLASVLTPEPGRGVPDTALGSAYPNPLALPSGCSFHPRCPLAMAQCTTVAPPAVVRDGRRVECHLEEA
jgi:peptide/nickel transport system ATP-binding protein